MLTRNRPGGYLHIRTEPTLAAARELEAEGYTLVREAFTGNDLDTLRQEAENVFEKLLPDNRGSNKKYEAANHFRYEMFNRSTAMLEVIGRREILDVIEPLLGEDCHVIANTCWRNPPGGAGHGGGSWHIDAGPHVPLTEDQIWPDEIPHPTFAVGVHLFLQDCELDSGPTGVIPGSHKWELYDSARDENSNMRSFVDVEARGTPIPIPMKAGDILLFHNMTFHGSKVNHTDGVRWSVDIRYVRTLGTQATSSTEQAGVEFMFEKMRNVSLHAAMVVRGDGPRWSLEDWQRETESKRAARATST